MTMNAIQAYNLRGRLVRALLVAFPEVSVAVNGKPVGSTGLASPRDKDVPETDVAVSGGECGDLIVKIIELRGRAVALKLLAEFGVHSYRYLRRHQLHPFKIRALQTLGVDVELYEPAPTGTASDAGQQQTQDARVTGRLDGKYPDLQGISPWTLNRIQHEIAALNEAICPRVAGRLAKLERATSQHLSILEQHAQKLPTDADRTVSRFAALENNYKDLSKQMADLDRGNIAVNTGTLMAQQRVIDNLHATIEALNKRLAATEEQQRLHGQARYNLEKRVNNLENKPN